MNLTSLTVLIMNLKTQIFAIIAMIIAFFAPIGPLLIIVGLAIFADTLFGIFKAYKRKQKITSRRMSAIISKMFLYQFCVIGVFVIDKYLLSGILSMFTSHELLPTKLVVLTLLSIELKSINENIEASFQINIWESLKKMVTRAKELKEDVEEIIDKKDDNE
jgi:hypothetical protein